MSSGSIDIAQVDKDRLSHRLFQGNKIQRAELLPFGDDDQRVRALRAFIGVGAIGNIVQHQLRLLHADRIEGAHLGALILQRR